MRIGEGFLGFDQENGLNAERALSAQEQSIQSSSHVRNSYVEDISLPQPVLIAPSSRIR